MNFTNKAIICPITQTLIVFSIHQCNFCIIISMKLWINNNNKRLKVIFSNFSILSYFSIFVQFSILSYIFSILSKFVQVFNFVSFLNFCPILSFETHDDCYSWYSQHCSNGDWIWDSIEVWQLASNKSASEDRAKRDPSYVYLRPILRQNSDL